MPILLLPDGGQLAYHTTNPARPPLLLLHGWTAYHAVWFAQRTFFREQFNVITPDFRGHGRSSKEHGLSVHQLANDIHELIQQLKLTEVIIVGHSMGALVLLDYIQTYGTTKLKKIVLVDQSPRLLSTTHWPWGIYGHFTEEMNQRFMQGLLYHFPTTMISFSQHELKDDLIAFADHYTGPLTMKDYIIPEIMVELWASIIRSDYRELLPHIDIPSLLIYGGLSQFYPRGTGHYMHDHIPHSQLTYIEDAHHSPLLEQPQYFNQRLQPFIR